jgi:hypothetical protein
MSLDAVWHAMAMAIAKMPTRTLNLSASFILPNFNS